MSRRPTPAMRKISASAAWENPPQHFTRFGRSSATAAKSR